MFIIHKKLFSIEKQLSLEKKLLQNAQKPFCIINEGTSSSVVLGINNKLEEHVNIKNTQKDGVAIIKRFSAGGAVFVDHNTLFVSFIISKKDLSIEFFPEIILRWAFNLYKPIFKNFNFQLIENDFVIDNKKIVGNALYIKKDRFLIHSSFLFDFDISKISKYLLFPPKVPLYREKREHKDFLTPLKNKISKNIFLVNLKKILKIHFYS